MTPYHMFIAKEITVICSYSCGEIYIKSFWKNGMDCN